MILLDLQLPGMSGAQTVTALREHAETSLDTGRRAQRPAALGGADRRERVRGLDREARRARRSCVAALDRAIGAGRRRLPGAVHRARPGGRRAPARPARSPRGRVLRGGRRAAGARDVRADPARTCSCSTTTCRTSTAWTSRAGCAASRTSARCRWSPTTPGTWRPPRTSADPRGPSPRSSRRARSAPRSFSGA